MGGGAVDLYTGWNICFVGHSLGGHQSGPGPGEVAEGEVGAALQVLHLYQLVTLIQPKQQT